MSKVKNLINKDEKILELQTKIAELESELYSRAKIETIVSRYSLGILGLMRSGVFDYELFKKTALRINECITRLNQLAQHFEKTGIVDKTIADAIESWAKTEPTPKSYKGVFR